MFYYELNNGVKIPQVGLGTFKAKLGEETYDAVLTALNTGYRHIDTAAVYGNEESVGKAVKDSGLDRKDIFVTTKVWNADQGYENTKKAFGKSLRKLQLDYVDLYLIHWPKTDESIRDTYSAMEELYQAGKIRALGVSNFQIHHLEHLLSTCKIKPTVNQVELHPRLQQHPLQKFCMDNGIYLTAYSPLMRGEVFNIPELSALSEKYHKSVANIIVRWGLQREIIMIPKSVTPGRIIDNFNVFDFELSDEDMLVIRKLNLARRQYSDPDNIDF